MKRNFLFLTITLFSLLGCINDIDMLEEEENLSTFKITSFKIEKALNPSINEDIEFHIYNNRNITAYATTDFDLSNLVVTYKAHGAEVFVEGNVQRSGVTMNDFSNEITYTIIDKHRIANTSYKVRLLPYTGLPVITIKTVDELEPQNKTTWLSAHMKIDGMGQFADYSDSLHVRGRGNASWLLPKKPFNIRLYKKSELLDMPSHRRWCFLPNYRDRTLMRNDVTLRLGQITDNLEWTPSGQFVEVIFNGKHQGNFYLCEHIRVDKNRLNIDEMKESDNSGEKLTGGYLLELDNYFDEDYKFRTPLNNWPVNLKSPSDDCTTEQFDYIQNYYNTVEEMLHNGQFEELYHNYIDIHSFIDYYIVQALTGNTETEDILSVYCYKKRSDKLFAGPLWDFDFSTFTQPDGTSQKESVWYKYLFNDAYFKEQLRQRFAQLKPKLSTWGPEYIRAKAAYLEKSEIENWKVWPIEINELGNRFNGDETLSYQEAIDKLVDMYNARLNYIETVIAQ